MVQVTVCSKTQWTYKMAPNEWLLYVQIPWSGVVHRVLWLYTRAYSRFVHSQWKSSLQSNTISHWLGASLESTQHSDKLRSCGSKTPCSQSEPVMKLLAIDWSWNDNFFKEVHFVCLQSLLKLQGSIDQIVKGHDNEWAMIHWWFTWHGQLTHVFPWTRCPPFQKRYFQLCFHEWKVLYFD